PAPMTATSMVASESQMLVSRALRVADSSGILNRTLLRRPLAYLSERADPLLPRAALRLDPGHSPLSPHDRLERGFSAGPQRCHSTHHRVERARSREWQKTEPIRLALDSSSPPARPRSDPGDAEPRHTLEDRAHRRRRATGSCPH